MKRKELILNPYFLTGLFILFLNDALFKWEFHNFLTGKLSDFAGMLIFPMFIAYLFSGLSKHAAWITGLGFIFWKSPMSNPVIEAVSYLTSFGIHRIVDYTDLLALLVLPWSQYLIQTSQCPKLAPQKTRTKIARMTILACALIVFSATSIRRFEYPKGTIYIGKSYSVDMTREEVLAKIEEMGLHWTFMRDSIPYSTRMGYYQVDSISLDALPFGMDNIQNIRFEMDNILPNNTRIHLINVTLDKPGHLQDWRELKRYSEFYYNFLKKHLISEIKK